MSKSKLSAKKKAPNTKKTQAAERRPGVRTLYVYVAPGNKQYAGTTGKKRYGSASDYVDHLISSDRKRKQAKVDARAEANAA